MHSFSLTAASKKRNQKVNIYDIAHSALNKDNFVSMSIINIHTCTKFVHIWVGSLDGGIDVH